MVSLWNQSGGSAPDRKLEGCDEGLPESFRGDLVAFTSSTGLLEMASSAI